MNRKFDSVSRSKYSFWVTMSPFVISLSLLLFFAKDSTLTQTVMLLLEALGAIVVFRYPTFGFGLIIISTPLAELLPQTSVLSSVSPLIGIVTLISYLNNKKYQNAIQLNLTMVEFLSLVFVLWIILSNPEASILGNSRSWAFTFGQLLMLQWMARQFVRSKKDHQTIIVIIAVGIIISATTAIQEIGSISNLNEFNRATGLSDGANTASRYFVYGIILLSYLQSQLTQQPIKRILTFAGIFILITALIFTGSRTGLILFIIATLFITQHYLFGKKRSVTMVMLIVIGLFLILSQISGSFLDTSHILSSILTGSDTVGSRYDAWRSGLAMWQNHPITGVGIGNFHKYVTSFWQSLDQRIVSTPHNTYVQVLSETGIIGFFIFISLLIAVVKNYLHNLRNLPSDIAQIQWAWLTILIIMLAGGFTKTDLADKFFWFLIGIGAIYHPQTRYA